MSQKKRLVSPKKPEVKKIPPKKNGVLVAAVKTTKPAQIKPTRRPQLPAVRNGHVGKNGVTTKDLAAKTPKNQPKGYAKDRVVSMVRDPYWVQIYWEISRQSVERAEAALGQDWYGAKPILRLIDVTSSDTSSSAEKFVRDVDIHGGCNSWYLEVANPRAYRIDIGYLAKSGAFYVVARSNVVSTPKAGNSDLIDQNWTDLNNAKADRFLAMSAGFDPTSSSLELKQLFEERLRRPMGAPAVTGFGTGAFQHGKQRKFHFELDAELIVYGSTEPNAKVMIGGEPVQLRPDGTFTMRFSLPDSRQIIPATAASADGIEDRTIVLAIERNTKKLEPMIHEFSE